jgi:hypothetical protein
MRLFSVVLAIGSLLAPSVAWACAVCGAAEQALPANGAEVAFAGRKRAAVDVRGASFTTSESAMRLTEVRVEPSVGAAIGDAAFASVGLPILHRTMTTGSARSAESMVGDLEVRVAHTPWRSATRRLTLEAGAKLPTAPVEHDPAGRLLPGDLQPGCSAVVPFVGASLRWSGPLWAAWTSASLLFPVSVRDAPHPGDSFRLSATLQLQPHRVLATRIAVHGRLDTQGEVDGVADSRSGGGMVHVAPEIALSPVTDLVVTAGASFPAVRAMRAYRPTAPVLFVGLALDF